MYCDKFQSAVIMAICVLSLERSIVLLCAALRYNRIVMLTAKDNIIFRNTKLAKIQMYGKRG